MEMMRLAAYVIGAGMSWAPAAPAMAAVAGTVDSLFGSVSISRNGAIGAFNPPSDRLTTPVVTLGIRGTRP
jgi:hypothetical protein